MVQLVDWNMWLTFIAALTFVAAVAIPIAQKKYEERKAKLSFHLYLKKYFGILFNILTYDKTEYTCPTIKDNPEKTSLTFPEFLNQFEKDFTEHKNTLQTRVAFSILFNLQNLFSVVHRINHTISQTDISGLYEKTLAYGNSLTKSELHKVYGIPLVMEQYASITSFHDRFGNLKAIKRHLNDGNWVGLKVEKSLLDNQQLVADDVKHLVNEELSIREVLTVNRLLIQELKAFFDFDNLQKKRVQAQAAQGIVRV